VSVVCRFERAQAKDDKESLRSRGSEIWNSLSSCTTTTRPRGRVGGRAKGSGKSRHVELREAIESYPDAYGKLLTLIKAKAVDAVVLRHEPIRAPIVTGRNHGGHCPANGCVIIQGMAARPSLNGDGDIGTLLVNAVMGGMAQAEVQTLVRRRRPAWADVFKNPSPYFLPERTVWLQVCYREGQGNRHRDCARNMLRWCEKSG